MEIIKIFLNKVFNKHNTPVLFVYFGPEETVCHVVPKLPKCCHSSWTITSCDNWEDLEYILLRKPNALIIHYSEIINKQDNSMESIVNIKPFVNIKIKQPKLRMAVLIDQCTPRYFIKELFGSNFIKNIVPSVIDFGLIEYATALTAILHETYYCHTKIINMLPAFTTITKYNKHAISGTLTPRQNEIAAMISKNHCSNKQIARILGISESAVKFHLKKIFKKHNVSSRLQLSNTFLIRK
jgi:DNA-binding CsgD family transcriptional regulator